MKIASGVIFFACFYTFASAVEKEFSDVTVTESIDDDPSRFVNVLLDMLVEKPILDEESALRILATFKVEGVNKNPAKAEAFTKATISTEALKGDADAARKFIKRLTKLFDDTDKQGLHLIEYLLELALDNALINANDAAKLAADEGYGVKIQMTHYTSSTQEVESKPLIPKKECCAKYLTTLIGTGATNDPYYIVYLADMTRLVKAFHDGAARRIDHTVATVAARPDACDCDGNGTKLMPVYWTLKGSDIRYVNEAEASNLEKSGYMKPVVYFYCAKTKGQCGANEPLRRYYFPGRQHVFTTSIEEGKKKVAAGWIDEGIFCYGWPLVHMGPPDTFSWWS